MFRKRNWTVLFFASETQRFTPTILKLEKYTAILLAFYNRGYTPVENHFAECFRSPDEDAVTSPTQSLRSRVVRLVRKAAARRLTYFSFRIAAVDIATGGPKV